MAYKYSTGSVRRGDIYFEDDRMGAATYIDFGQDTITLRPSGAAQLYVEDEKVGIGTTSPDHTLHVTSPGTCHVKIESEAGYEAALKLSQDGQSSAYVWMPGSTSDLRFYINGEDVMHLDGDGNVGIGTTDPKNVLDVHVESSYFQGLADDEGGGLVVKAGSGTLTTGRLYYLHTDGTWTEANANSTVNGADQLLGIALGSSPTSHGVLLRGFFDAATAVLNYSAGKVLYVDTAGGKMNTTAPSAASAFVRMVGYCGITPNVIYFNPSKSWVEIAS